MPSSFTQALLQTADRIRAAQADRTALCIRGGGSKDFYGNSLHGERLDTTALNSVISYEPTELVVTVGAGTPLAELESVLAERGQCLPFEPPHFQWSATAEGTRNATVGGMVAAGLSGPARANAGAVREYVLGLHMLNGRGEALEFGGQVMKNVAGYDVSRMMVGSMGTLGLITQVSLKVLPIAAAEATLAFVLDQASALECLHRWGGKPLPLNASYWVQDRLLVRLRGAVAAVEAACQNLPGQRLAPEQAHTEWLHCRNQQLPFFTQPGGDGLVLWRLSLAQTAPALNLPWPQLVEWHGGLRWLWAPLDAQAQLQALAQSHGGHATLFAAPGTLGTTEAKPLFLTLDPVQLAIQQRLKQSLDPYAVFNPYRLFPNW